MNLHQNPSLFRQAIAETSDKSKIRNYFVEKDYWITYALKCLAKSDFKDDVVFKGGTSLSKGYALINRFSEDVDLAIVNTGRMTGNQIKNLIRKVEKEITQAFKEVPRKGITSKGSRFRKSVYKYPSTDYDINISIADSTTLIVEINSFANPYPFVSRKITSLAGTYLEQLGKRELIEAYELHPFDINVLDKRRTLIEKLVSLIRFSFDADPEAALRAKIRHFYDIYYLCRDPECRQYTDSENFLLDTLQVLKDDQYVFDEPPGWKATSIRHSVLLNDFNNLWKSLEKTYSSELPLLAFGPIPDAGEVFLVFSQLLNRLTEE